MSHKYAVGAFVWERGEYERYTVEMIITRPNGEIGYLLTYDFYDGERVSYMPEIKLTVYDL